jgi:hypothetical protein
LEGFIARQCRKGESGARNSGVRSTPTGRAPGANFKYQREVTGVGTQESGVAGVAEEGRSHAGLASIREQGLYPKIQDQHLPGKIFAKLLPDSLAPELLQLLTPEFRNVLGGQAQVSEKQEAEKPGESPPEVSQ